MNHHSPTRRSPRNHLPVEGLGKTVKVIFERPPDTNIAAAHAAIIADDLASLRHELASCNGWFDNGVHLLHYAASKGASANAIEVIGNVIISEGIQIK